MLSPEHTYYSLLICFWERVWVTSKSARKQPPISVSVGYSWQCLEDHMLFQELTWGCHMQSKFFASCNISPEPPSLFNNVFSLL